MLYLPDLKLLNADCSALNWLCILPWFWPWCCPWSLTFSHTPYIPLINKSYCLSFKIYQKLKHLTHPQFQHLRPNHLHASPRLIMIFLSLVLMPQPQRWALNTTAQVPFDRTTVSLLFKIPLQSPLMIKITLRNLFPMTPQTSSSLLWPSVSSLTLNTCRVRYSRLFPPC